MLPHFVWPNAHQWFLVLGYGLLAAAGAVLLMLFPRRDRDIRWFALLISVLTFLASLHLPWH
jgi:NADH:ubiquinone oxidoreductase subunit 4 (subunit M)